MEEACKPVERVNAEVVVRELVKERRAELAGEENLGIS